MAMDQDDVDLLIVMGSSLKVGPVNDIPDAIDESVPRILSMLCFYDSFKGNSRYL